MRNIMVAFGNTPLGPWHDISEPFTEQFTEGPTVAKVGEDYLIFYDAYRKKTYEASKTSDFKTFVDISDQVSLPEGHKHGTIFKAKESVLKNLIQNSKAEK